MESCDWPLNAYGWGDIARKSISWSDNTGNVLAKTGYEFQCHCLPSHMALFILEWNYPPVCISSVVTISPRLCERITQELEQLSQETGKMFIGDRLILFLSPCSLAHPWPGTVLSLQITLAHGLLLSQCTSEPWGAVLIRGGESWDSLSTHYLIGIPTALCLRLPQSHRLCEHAYVLTSIYRPLCVYAEPNCWLFHRIVLMLSGKVT